MKPADFKAWMENQGLRTADVAHFTKLNINTVYSFLRGNSIHPATYEVLARFRETYVRKESVAV